jgi:hypothetical protein
MSRQYDVWVQQQLEPTDNLFTRGKQKRDKELPVKILPPDKYDAMTAEEKAAMDDKHLLKHNIK